MILLINFICVKNSFEQLCINLANEALQRHFNVNIFQREIEIYVSEDIKIPDLSYNDNQDVLDLIIKKPKGMIPMLDEEGQVPKGTWEGFLSKFTKHHIGNSNRLKYRSGTQVFTLVHYAGEVTYDPSLFILKNKDSLSVDMSEAMAISTVPLFAELFYTPPEESSAGGAANKVTVGTKFRIQLDALMASLNMTEPRYIRCIKPNSLKKGGIFDAMLTNEQLTYSGVFEAVVIMQNGYPFRLSHEEFRNRYHMLVMSPQSRSVMFNQSYPSIEDISVRKGTKNRCGKPECLAMVRHISIAYPTVENCHIGNTLVFYRAEQHRALETARKQLMKASGEFLMKIMRGYIARNIYRAVKLNITNCKESIFSKNAEEIDECVAALDDLLSKINMVYKFIVTKKSTIQCIDIGKKYSHAIKLENSLNKSISRLLLSADIFAIFDSLYDFVKASKDIKFTAVLDNKTIDIHWEQDRKSVV